MRLTRNIILAFVYASLFAFALTEKAFATVTVTGASGGGAISADTAATAASPAWTTLGTITIAEGANADFATGSNVTLVLKAPAGFEFNTGVTPNITFTAGRNISAASLAMTNSTTITITITVSATTSSDTLTIGNTTGIRVRPTAGTPLSTGKHLYRPTSGGGTATISGITTNATGAAGTNFGNLTEVPGAIACYTVAATSPQVAGTPFSTTVTAKDQFGNTVTTDSTTVVTMTGTGYVEFDSHDDHTFGDLTKTLVSGAFVMSTVDLLVETVNITATDGNSKTGTVTGIVVATGTGAYRSATSGNWNVLATWERWSGSAWLTPTSGQGTPTSGSLQITIQNGHTVTVTASVTVDGVYIESGGHLTVGGSSVTLTIASGVYVDLHGVLLINSGNTVLISSGGVLEIDTGLLQNAGTLTTTGALVVTAGTYQHAQNGGTIPTATWAATSTCLVTGVTTTAPGGLAQTFAQFTWNCAGQTGSNLSLNTLTTVNGDFTLTSTGSGSLRFANSETQTLSVAGNFIISGGTLRGVIGGGSLTLNIGGDYNQSGGTFDLATSTGGSTINLTGNFTQTAGTMTESGTSLSDSFNFVGTSTTRTFSSSGTISNMDVFVVNSGATMTLNSNFPAASGVTLTINGTLNCGTSAVTGAGALTLSSGATFVMGSPAGITSTASTGNIQVTGTRTYSTGANYIYRGSSAQSTGNQLPATVNNLTIENSGGDVTLTSNTTVNGVLALNEGDLVTGANTLSMASGATSSASPFPGSDVIGNVKRTNSFSTGSAYDFGNQFTTINFSGSGTKPTAVNVNLAKSCPSDFGNSVRRTYTITPTGGSGFSATVQLHFLDAEMNGNAPDSLELWRKDGSTWTLLGVTSFDHTEDWVQKTGVTDFGPFTIAEPSGPTEVTMVSYSANRGGDGKVLIEWETGFEVDNLGFNVYREESGNRVRVNRSLIAGSALLAQPGTRLTAGRSYAWRDNLSQGGNAAYWLEEIDLNGRSIWHGPVFTGNAQAPRGSYEIASEQAMTLSDLNSDATQQAPTMPVEQTARLVMAAGSDAGVSWTLGSQAAVKLAVKSEGFYRVSRAELLAAGLNPTTDPRYLQLFVAGQEQSFKVVTDAKGQLSAIEFYGVGVDAPSTDANVYWLAGGAKSGKRIQTSPSQGWAAAPSSFQYTVERRDRLIYASGIKNGDLENFFGTPVGSSPVDQVLTLQHVDQSAQSQATLEVALQGLSLPAHYVTVSLNGAQMGAVAFTGQASKAASFAVPGGLLLEGQNTVTLAGQTTVLDISLVDRIRITYWHTFTADGNALKLTMPAGQFASVGGFTTGDIRVVDVTDPGFVQEVSAKVTEDKAGYAVMFAAPGTGSRSLLAFAGDQVRAVCAASANEPSSWRTTGNSADLVIIAHKDLRDQFKGLQSLRQRQGLKVALVDVEDLYDEFSYGGKSPQAIKDFLSYAQSNWKKAPRYVLLGGTGSYDPRNYNGFAEYDLVPTRLIDTAFSETASDDWFADFNLDGIPEMSVGRLPVRNAEEAAATVTKLLAYEGSAGFNSALLVADDNLGFDFEAANNQLAGMFPKGFNVQKIDRGQLGTVTAKQRLLEGIASGQGFVNYVGHGSPSVWRDNLLTAADALALTNIGRYPLFVAMTCLNGQFQHPELNPLASALMNAREGGAIAVWASSGFTQPSVQATMNRQFYALAFQATSLKGGPAQQTLTLGDVTSKAKAAVSDLDIRRTWILFGDPSMRLK